MSGSDRRGRHDGKDPDPTHAPGPVRRLDPLTFQPLDDVGSRAGRRVDVGKQEKERQRRNLLARVRDVSFAEQKKLIERSNAIVLARIARQIEDGEEDDDTIASLAKCAAIAKQFLVEERATGDTKDPAQMTNEELERRLQK